MRIFNAIVGLMLLGLAVLHGFIPKTPLLSAIYAAGAVMALGSLWRNISFGAARVLAFLTVAAMFFYFAAFFRIVDHFHENWYRGGMALEAVGMLLSAFAMIPVLSVFSCRMKADCVEPSSTNRALFSAPDSKEADASAQTP
jgi:heme/copper-type cytochrome/quinol oxidase subunit 2|tara:strand:- start:1726 stop:2151 length:426 start_codon:yes stop_codon:yes gene_type:complete